MEIILHGALTVSATIENYFDLEEFSKGLHEGKPVRRVKVTDAIVDDTQKLIGNPEHGGEHRIDHSLATSDVNWLELPKPKNKQGR